MMQKLRLAPLTRDRLESPHVPRILIIAGAVFYLLAITYGVTVFTGLNDNINYELQTSCAEVAHVINDRLEDTTEELLVIADTIDAGGATSYTDYIDALRALHTGFDLLGILADDGRIYATGSTAELEHINMPSAHSVRASAHGIISASTDSATGERALICAIELPEYSTLSGCIFGAMFGDGFTETLLEGYYYHDTIFVIDGLNEIIHASIPATDIAGGSDFPALNDAMLRSVYSNYDTVRHGGYIITSAPLTFNGWSVITLLHADNIWTGGIGVGTGFVVVSVTMLLALLCAAVYVITLKTRGTFDIRRQSEIDEATGLNNSRGFVSEANALFARFPAQRFALVYTCCDSHTTYALEHGTEYGRDLQSEVARLIKADCEGSEICAHVSGGSYMMLWRFSSTPDLLMRVKELNSHIAVAGDQHMRFHYGIYLTGSHEDDTCDTMIMRSSQAANRIMRHGDLVGLYDDELYNRRQREEEMLRAAPDALKNGEFEVVYRPVRDINTHRIVGAEAAPLWRRADGSVLKPRAFMSLFNKNGVLAPINEYIIERAIADIGRQHEEGRYPDHVMMRVSRENILDSGFLPRAQELMRRHGLSAGDIELIIDDDVLQSEPRLAASFINNLQSDGCKVCLNAYTDGVTSMNVYGSVRFDSIRLSHTFANHVFKTELAPQAIRGIAAIAESVNADLFVEGDLSREMIETLRQCGIAKYQNLLDDGIPGNSFCKLDEVQQKPAPAESDAFDDWA